MPYEEKPVVQVVPDPESDDPTPDEPGSNDPTPDEPKSDDPTPDRPSTDDPAQDKPGTDNPSTDSPDTGKSVADDQKEVWPGTGGSGNGHRVPRAVAPAAGVAGTVRPSTVRTGDASAPIVGGVLLLAAAAVMFLARRQRG